MALLLAAGFDDGQPGFDEAANGVALGSGREFAPNDGVTKRAFAAVVRRLQPGISRNSRSWLKRANRSLHKETIGTWRHRCPSSMV